MTETAQGQRALLAFVALASLLSFVALFSRFSTIPDSDSYYHLAIAELYGQQGFVEGLEWTRFSVFATRLGDKEFLFHVFLMPFVRFLPGEVGGRLALALLCALIATLLARLGLALGGRGAIVLPLVAFIGSPFFYARAFRLRPELLALILLLVALELLARRKRVGLAIVSLAYALSYTAVQVLPALVIAIGLVGWLRERDPDTRSILACLGGTLAGLLLHPHFPDNLATWWLQNVDFFRLKGQLDVGHEINPPSLSGMITLNAGFWLALLALLVLTKGLDTREEPDRRTGDAFLVATLTFFALFTRMERMITYFVPFALVAVPALLRARGRDLATIHIGPLRVPTAIVLVLCSLVGLPRVLDFTSRVSSDPEAEAAWKQVAERIPENATVAAHWGPTGFLVFFAPQGRYLNVLDPLFMYEADPDIWLAQKALFEGRTPDAPLVAATTLDSTFLFATSGDPVSSGVLPRLAQDPRLRVHRVEGLALAEVVPDANRAFVLDWVAEDGTTYPRLSGPAGGLEGFVDVARIGAAGQCTWLEHTVKETDPETVISLTFAPYGPATLELDGTPLLESSGNGAVLESSASLIRRLGPGPHRFRVRSCPDPATGINGFYLIER